MVKALEKMLDSTEEITTAFREVKPNASELKEMRSSEANLTSAPELITKSPMERISASTPEVENTPPMVPVIFV